MTRYIFPLVLLFFSLCSVAQKPKLWTSGQIHEAIQKLNVLGTALYVAAHPDDENTLLISYLANDRKYNTAYLSMTRGDGGQNLIGPEINELLGVIRTQELLAARAIDGGRQFFTRANDFGYSKNPEETMKIWGKDEILADAVWVIRKFRPDVMIMRFNPDDGGRTHGHHTASAILAMEAFDLAGDPNAFPEQLKYVEPWQPKTIYHNTSWFFYGSRERFEQEVDLGKMMSVDVGVYYPIKGKSNNEIAAESRSMHKCQGFGNIGSRGSQNEYLEYRKGIKPQGDIFDMVNTSWSRVKGGSAIGELIAAIDSDFDHIRPYRSIDALLQVYKMIENLDDDYWKAIKLAELKEIIKGCMGLYAEAITQTNWIAPGQEVQLTVEATNRSPVVAKILNIQYNGFEVLKEVDIELPPNQSLTWKDTLLVPVDAVFTNAYWLNEPGQLGQYRVDDQRQIGLPETEKPYHVKMSVQIQDIEIELDAPLSYKERDRVDAEVYKPFEIVPPVFANIDQEVMVFADDQPKRIQVRLKSAQTDQHGTVRLELPDGWKSLPGEREFSLTSALEEKTFDFEIWPPPYQEVNRIKAVVQVGDRTFSNALKLIEYDHIPMQTVLSAATARVVKVELKKEGSRIGYIMGAGDDIPACLEEIGYEVDILDPSAISAVSLQYYDAVIAGVRAYNTEERLRFTHEEIMKYVENGGTYIVQYNTSRGLVTNDLGPYPISLSSARVSVEDAPVRFLKPDHLALNYPNKITEKDFEGWIQERGLYFPGEWSDEYEALLSSNDPGEPGRDGGLLVARFGEGYFVYSGYSWFRELPAGVPGAYRIFANLVSLGNITRP